MEMNQYLYGACIGLDVNHVPDENLFFKDSLVDCWIETQLLGPLDSFETHDDVGDRLAITTEGIFGLRGREFRHFSFINLLCLLYPQP